MPNRMRSLSIEARRLGNGLRGACPIFGARDLDMVGQHLHVEDLEAPLAQALRAGSEGDLRGAGLAMEHRLAGEERAHGDSVQSAGEAIFVPDLDAVRPAEVVQLVIRGKYIRCNPCALARPLSARAHHLSEGVIEGDAKIRLERALDGSR